MVECTRIGTSTLPNWFRQSDSRSNDVALKQSRDAIALLRDDHRELKKLFKDFADAKGEGRKQKLAHQICLELMVHSEIEETIFYPACEDSVEKDDLKEAYVEHDTAKLLIAEIEAAEEGTEDEFFDTKVKVLQEEIEHHIEEEEGAGGIFSQARKGKLDMNAIGEQLARRKKELNDQYEAEGLPRPKLKTMDEVSV
jgi:hemerythrin superfamily protein